MTHANISQNEYGEKIKKSSLITLGVVLFLIFIKAFAYFATGSIIILSLLADSFFDLIITLTTFILVRISLKKNTNEYRFGYGKAEALSAFIEGIIILLISIFILYMAYQNFIDPEITIINSKKDPLIFFTDLRCEILDFAMSNTICLSFHQIITNRR